MYAALDSAMEKNLSQVELYYEIGRAVCQRTEKGAAVAAAKYLSEHYSDVQGFSPRNLRRMRDFYRVYENHPALQAVAMQVCWTQNVVILEADLSVELREWYLMAVSQFGWSKAELSEKIANNAHDVAAFAIDGSIVEQEETISQNWGSRLPCKDINIQHLIQKVRCWMEPKKGDKRRWFIMPCPIISEKGMAFMRCKGSVINLEYTRRSVGWISQAPFPTLITN